MEEGSVYPQGTAQLQQLDCCDQFSFLFIIVYPHCVLSSNCLFMMAGSHALFKTHPLVGRLMGQGRPAAPVCLKICELSSHQLLIEFMLTWASCVKVTQTLTKGGLSHWLLCLLSQLVPHGDC